MDTKFSVALHILMFISETDKIASSEVLATSVNTNSSHIRKIISNLKNANLITSQQGKSGFTLAKDKKEIFLSDVYLAIHPEKNMLNIHGEPNMACPVGKNVKNVLEPIFENAQSAFLKELEKETLDDLVKRLYKVGKE